jgi:hypothetical protein
MSLQILLFTFADSPEPVIVGVQVTAGLNNDGEGRDSNPRVVLPTAASKPAAALANGDLSKL